MRLSRSRGTHPYSPRDFDRERAELAEGFQNYVADSQAIIAEVEANPSYSPERKKAILMAYREEALQYQEEYYAQLQRINAEEAEYYTGEAQYDTEESYAPSEQPAAYTEEEQIDYGTASPSSAQSYVEEAEQATQETSNDNEYGV